MKLGVLNAALSASLLVPSIWALGDAPNPPASSRLTNLAEGLKRARAENRLVVVDFWRENCLYCVRMERETFVDPRVTALLGNYVMVRAKNTDHAAEIQRYRVEGYPTLAILDHEGTPIDVHVGYLGAGEFSSWLTSSADRYRRMSALRARIARDPGDLEALLALGRLYSGEGQRAEARKYLEEVVRADPGGRRHESAEAHLEIGLTWRRTREYRKAVESLARARETALARLAAEEKTTPGNPEQKSGDGDLLDRVLFELITTQLLAGQRQALLKTLEEYDTKVIAPDARRHASVLLQLGRASSKAGDPQAAEGAFRRCDQLYPRSSEARECREALAELKDAGTLPRDRP